MRIVSKIAAFLASVSLVACGGGGSGAGSSLYNPGGDGAGGNVTATVSDIVLQLDKPAITSADAIAVTATAVDASRNVIAAVPIKLSVDSNAVLTTSAAVTDAQGKVTGTVTAGSDTTSRTVTVTALSGSLQKTASFQVTAGGATGAVVADIALTLDKATITNLPTNTVTATATAVDASRAALVGIPVTFSVDSKAVVSAATSATDAQGQVSATVRIGDDTSARIVTVTAKAGALFKTASFAVSGSDPTTTLPVKEIQIQADKASVPNISSSNVVVKVTAVDDAGRTMTGIPVTFAVNGSAVLTPAGSVTDSTGNISANVGLGTNLSNRVVTVTAKAGVLEKTVSFQVIGAQLAAAAVPAVVDPSSVGNKLQYRLTDSNAAAMPNVGIVITDLNGASTTATTGLNGDYEYAYAAPATAGTLVFNATAGGATVTKNVVVRSSVTSVPNASGTIDSATINVDPSVVTANTSGTSNQSQIRALFVGVNDTRISNVRVRFERLENNVWIRDLSSGDSLIYSDSQGLATAAFTPGSASSPTNGVIIRACYDAADFSVGACPNETAPKTLTVVSEGVSVTIQPADKIEEGDPSRTYIMKFTVMVVDAAGRAKPEVQISPSVDIESYAKGFYKQADGAWTIDPTATPPIGRFGPVCGNEDLNRNAILETGEDLNGNGKLDPVKADVAVSIGAPGKTDANGKITLQVEYPKAVASWINVKVLVAANGVSGTEGRNSWSGVLPVSVDDINSTGTPAFAVSPYGRNTSAIVNVLDAQNRLVGLCTDPN